VARVQVDKIVIEIVKNKHFFSFHSTWIMIPDGNESIGPKAYPLMAKYFCRGLEIHAMIDFLSTAMTSE
jgi:hypothetical protein